MITPEHGPLDYLCKRTEPPAYPDEPFGGIEAGLWVAAMT
jgi:hypothetical protein